MQSIGILVRQTIARTGLLATLLLALPASEITAQTPQSPSGTGVQLPSNEELIEKSSKSSVKADAIWIEITKLGKNPSRCVLDLNREGSCYVLRDQDGERRIYGGSGISPELVKRAFTLLTQRRVIYSSRGRPSGPVAERELVGIGMATWDGSRVYKTQSGALDSYPEEVQKIVNDLRKSVEQFPLSAESVGSIHSTFLRPDEARRMLTGGKRIVTVEDSGRNPKELSTLEMSLRLPGRDIVVPTADDWEALKTYVIASNPENPESGEFFVKSSSRMFRIKMDAAAGANDVPGDSEIPRARPVRQ